MAAATLAAAAPVAVLNAGGCNSGPATTQPMTASQRQDAILKDPMGYKPQVGPDTAGGDGGITHLDNDGLKKDLNDVFNP